MSVTDGERRDLYVRLEQAIGPTAADNMMKLLPPIPSDQIVTRTDHLAQTARLQGEMAELRGELTGEMAELRAELRGEMVDLRGELTGEMGDLRGEMTDLRGEMVQLRADLEGQMAELRADVRTEIAGLQKWAAGILAANGVALIAALFL